MGKIEALKNVTPQIVEIIERNENKMNISKPDLHFLVDRYNENNTSEYKYRDVDVCGDCRQAVFRFWKFVVEEWKKNTSK